MSQPHPDSEEALELEAMDLFSSLGWESVNCMQEIYGINSTLRRETRTQVVLIPRLRSASQQLNPDLPNEAIQLAIEELTHDRSSSLKNTNREIYLLLKDGVKVSFKEDEEERVETVKIIDWNTPENNSFLLAARANRVFRDKVNGLIVDYIGVFRNLQKALAIYDAASGGGIQEGETPVKAKSALIEQLRQAIAEATDFCTARGIDSSKLRSTQGAFERTKVWADAIEAILVNDDSKRTYFSLAGNITRLYKAILPDPNANEFTATEAFFSRLTQEIRSEVPDVDISQIKAEVEDLLDTSITAENYVTSGQATQAERVKERAGTYQIKEKPLVNLSQIDFEALKVEFGMGYQRTKAEKLKGTINQKLQRLVSLNRSRMNYLEKFQQMIEEYNSGSRNVEQFFNVFNSSSHF